MRETASRNYLLAVLLVILAFNYVDRLALGLLLQDIKVDLDLSDTKLGFLSLSRGWWVPRRSKW